MTSTSHHSGFSSPTPTVIASPPQPNNQRQQEGAGDDGHRELNDTLIKPTQVSLSAPGKETNPNVVTWDDSNDPANPRNWSLKYRWFVTFLISVNNLNVTYSSSSPSTTAPFIAHDFHSSREVSYFVTSLFLLGYVFGPIFWGPGSEMFGRRAVLIPTLAAYTLFHLGQALAHNMATLLVTRFLSGFFASGPLNNSGGVMADLWDAAGRGPAASLLFTSIFLGPALGPVVSGFIVSSDAGWRWVFWVEMIFAGVCTIVSFFLMPETYGSYILQQKAKRLRKEDPVKNKDLRAEGEVKWTLDILLERTLYRPFKMLVQEPILVLVTLYTSMVYAVLYALFEAFPVIFIGHHKLSISHDGLIFLGVGIGTTLGAVSNLWIEGERYKYLIKHWRGFPPPEQRLYGAVIGGPLLVIGCFWLGWTGAYNQVPWYVPALSTIVIGAAIGLVYLSFLSYLVDTYLMFAASAFAANTMVRSATAAAFPLFTTQMFNNMGIQWAATLIGLIATVLAPIPLLFLKFGARIRTRSRFAPCIDLKIAKELEAEQAAREKDV
ncbi:MFS polyamine transporter [Multifurca ochricompacta]|uniref:MFS polyamine transporter n=1 Tax=Multifurca ochricompacta TaxID=376703 RepID=A0AAD4M3X2_9AGAM|nr:MFS polyamine transporter [Multifurca ochricompacta]